MDSRTASPQTLYSISASGVSRAIGAMNMSMHDGAARISAMGGDAMLREMRRSTVWFAIAAFWFVEAVIIFSRHGRSQAWLPLGISVAFLIVGARFRSKERR